MELLDQLKQCRAGALATLDLFDLLIGRVESLNALTAPVVNGGRAPGSALPAKSRRAESVGIVLASLSDDWMTAGEIIAVVRPRGITEAALFAAVRRLIRLGKVKRRGSRGLYQYRRMGRAASLKAKPKAKPTAPGGAAKPAILAHISGGDWFGGSAIKDAITAGGASRSSVASALYELHKHKQIERRGKSMHYEYRTKSKG